ncbi:MAG: type IV pilus assembly protein PilM [Planctomycetia bacterium]|nr:type IV pilus assembly protein PilM [Planctomycetia bacterium]
MARSPYVWGIDIGKCAIKAVRCRMSTQPGKLTVEAFDYIEYPMILTQPEADPVALVQSALQEFIGRNTLKGDRVAVAVAGQSGLTKFIKLPPIEAKKIPDIVKYEARQQIPFPLEQVVWDWQRLAGGMEESGFVLDAEVAVFAMKKEQVAKALAPFMQAGIPVDLLQLAPVALANVVIFDQMPHPTPIDPDAPQPSIVLVSTGVDSTDLVITNGMRIWQRSFPLGGSNFTKALVNGMKLTFAKAEHLKRNAVRAEDPKLVFKAMRPVFNEFASELQRSLNYFTGADRKATIGKVLLLGNPTKLRGLSDFVAKQLQLDVQRLDTFRNLEGPAVLAAPAFRENRLAFGTAYGLALQAAGGASISTNLLPREILQERLIESKKPWAVGALVGLLVASFISFVGMFFAWTTYAPPLYAKAFSQADGVKTRSQAAIAALDDVKQKQDAAIAQQQYLLRVEDRRFQMLDMLRAVESLLPRDEPGKVPEGLGDRNELHIDRMECEWFPDLTRWFAGVEEKWAETHPAEDPSEEPPSPADVEPAAPAIDEPPPTPPGEAVVSVAADRPSGPGWVIEMKGHHFHNETHHKPHQSVEFVRSTIIKNLLGKESNAKKRVVQDEAGEDPQTVMVSTGPLAGQLVDVSDLGIAFPVIVESSPVKTIQIPDPRLGGPGEQPVDKAKEKMIDLKRYDFILQFCWQPTVPGSPKPPPPPAASALPVSE